MQQRLMSLDVKKARLAGLENGANGTSVECVVD